MARGYHHGNLRTALLNATRELIAEKSPQGFTIAEAAKRAGVSSAAPYRHFKGRDDLIAALAMEGFADFSKRLQAALSGGRTPFDRLNKLGAAYLDFAREDQGAYMAMFESGLNIASDPVLKRAADEAFEALESAAQDILAQIPNDKPRPPSSMIAQHIWATSHGIAELFARGSAGRNSPFDPNDMLEAAIRIYLKGLGVKL